MIRMYEQNVLTSTNLPDYISIHIILTLR